MKKIVLLLIFIFYLNASYLNAKECVVPSSIAKLIVSNNINSLIYINDVKRNYNKLKNLCTNLIAFKEGRLNWKMLLVTNPKKEHGLFWFLPHDNENSAFDSAIYAVAKYGGGFLSIVNNNRRYNLGQDPNRNFSYSKARICKEQLAPSPIYTSVIFNIINYYKDTNLPYLALHNNTNGGRISILKSNSKTKSYLAYPKSQIVNGKGLQDEDNLVYTAGLQHKPPSMIFRLLEAGLNVKYEIVTNFNNDCSMSNFVVLELDTNNYYNIEAQHGETWIQKEMIDRLIKAISN